MNKSAYLIVHNDSELHIDGINCGAGMATLSLARFLARLGERVVVAGQLTSEERASAGVTFWNLGEDFNVSAVLERARSLGSYHLLSCDRVQAILESRSEVACKSRTLISNSRSGNDLGVGLSVLSGVASGIVCVSNAQRDVFISNGAVAEKVHVIHGGVDLEKFSVGAADVRNYRKLIFTGALVPDKGIQLLVPAFVELRNKYSDLTLDVFGESTLWGHDPMFDTDEVSMQVPGITFHGNVSQERLAGAYQSAGLAVVPSIWFDPFTLVAIEAQVCGCPVVTSDVGGLREAVQDGETGVVLPEPTQEALTSTLDSLLENPERLQRMSERAAIAARRYFNWERVAREIIQLTGSYPSDSINPKDYEMAVDTQKAGRTFMHKRIGVMTPWNQECGLATYAKFFVSEFDTDTVVVFAEEEEECVSEDEHFVIRCWQREKGGYERLLRSIEKQDIGVLHINAHYRFFQFPDFGRFLEVLREKGVKSILTLHSAFTKDSALTELLTSVDKVLVHTPEVRLETIACGAHPDAVEVIPHGVVVHSPLDSNEQSRSRSQLSMPRDKKIIVASGFVQPHKGMDAVLSAVLGLKQAGIDACGYIAGKPNESDPNSSTYLLQLKELAANAGIEDRIHFLDRFLSDEELTAYLQAADLVMMNYQSQHYEASGACSLAVGAGALVATSVAPPFAAFGDAVWHITAGYPADLSAYLLLTNEMLAAQVKESARQYSQQNSWAITKERLFKVYRACGVEPTAAVMVESETTEQTTLAMNKATEERGATPAPAAAATRLEMAIKNISTGAQSAQTESVSNQSATGIRVLMQNRSNALTQPGGDTIVMRRTIEALEAQGIEVVLDLEGQKDPDQFDIVHLFNFALPGMIETLGRRAMQAGTPFVVTTLSEDAPAYRNQGMTLASFLMDYVDKGQPADWYRDSFPQLCEIPPADRFPNDWVAHNAAALLTNGTEESRVIQRDYGKDLPLFEVPLGFDFAESADPELFVREFGVRDFILCVGRLEFRKNQLMLLKALEESDVPLVLAAGGFSYDQEYSNAVQRFNRKGRTVITQRLSNQMLASAYAAARVHVLPSWYELPGLVSLEAAHHGCGIVASLYGTAADYLGEAAYYCDPADENSVLQAIEAAMKNPKADALKKRVAEFTWDNMGEETIRVYKQVLDQSSAVEEEIEVVETKNDTQHGEVVIESPQITLDSGGYDFAPGTTEFQELLERGELAAKQKEYNLAHDLLFRAEKLSPQSVRVLRARGAVYLAENHIASSRRYFERAFELDEQDPKTLSGLGMCFMNDKETRLAYECFVKALEHSPDSLVAILQLLECSYALEKFDDLVRVLRAYLELHPADDEMRFCLAGALFKQGMIREAREMLKAVLQGSTDHAGATQLMALIEETSSSQESSLPFVEQTAIDQAVEIEKSAPLTSHGSEDLNMEVESLLASVEEQKRRKEFTAALENVSEILAGGELAISQWERAHCVRAELTVLSGEIMNSIAMFDTVLERVPDSARALAGKGAVAATAAQWGEAERLFQQSLACTPEYDVALAGLGLCAAARENLPAAWTYYMKALDSNPENMRALLGVLEIGYPMKRFEEIETVLQRYIDLHPGDTEFLYSLAGCYYVQGKVMEASNELSKLMLLSPDHSGGKELSDMIAQKGKIETEAGL